jgi:lipopolysaccharide export system protein LptA
VAKGRERMTGKRGLSLGAIVFSLVLLFTAGEAQDKKGSSKGGEKNVGLGTGLGFDANSRAPIDISSDTVEGDQKQNTVTFKGNVIAKQENTTIYANVLLITYDTENKKVREIVASGNVKVVNLDRRATGQKVIFYQDENKVVLEGDAVIREGENVVRGERVTYYINEERSVVESGKGGRVTTTIVPPKKEETKK